VLLTSLSACSQAPSPSPATGPERVVEPVPLLRPALRALAAFDEASQGGSDQTAAEASVLEARALAETVDCLCACTDLRCVGELRREVSQLFGRMIGTPLSRTTRRFSSDPAAAEVISGELRRVQPCLERLRAQQASSLGPAQALPTQLEVAREVSLEAGEQLAHLFRSTASYFNQDWDGAPRLPATAPLSPARPCCQGSDGLCAPDPSTWMHDTWQGLNFFMPEAHRLQYKFESDSGTFRIQALYDPGCNGDLVTFERSGRVDEQGYIESIGTGMSVQGWEEVWAPLALALLRRSASQFCGSSSNDAAVRGWFDDVLLDALPPQQLPHYEELLRGERQPSDDHEAELLSVHEALYLCLSALRVTTMLEELRTNE